MRNQSRLPFLLVLFIPCVLPINSNVIAQSNGGAGAPQPPMAEKKTKTTNIHGDTIVDDYFWLREKTNPSVLAHLQAEDAYAESAMKHTAALQEKLYNEMLSHIKQTDKNVPYRWGNYFYYTRTEEGKQYPIYCRKKGSPDAPEEIVLDQNELAKGQKFMSVGDVRAQRRWKPARLQHRQHRLPSVSHFKSKICARANSFRKRLSA